MSTEWNINIRRNGRVKGKRKRVPPAPCCWWLGGACWGGTWECWTARATQRPSLHPRRCSHPPSHTRQMLLMQPENTSNKQSRAYTTGSVHCRDSSHLCDTTHTCRLIWDKQWPGTLLAPGDCKSLGQNDQQIASRSVQWTYRAVVHLHCSHAMKGAVIALVALAYIFMHHLILNRAAEPVSTGNLGQQTSQLMKVVWVAPLNNDKPNVSRIVRIGLIFNFQMRHL